MTWSTANVAASSAFPYWNEIVCASIMPLRIDSSMRQDFSATLTQRAFGPASISFVTASPQETIWRTQRELAKQKELGFHLMYLRQGHMTLQQHGREATVVRGECILLNCEEPSRWSFPEYTDCIALHLSRPWLQTWLPSPEDASALTIGSKAGWGVVLCAALANLDPEEIGHLPIPQITLVDQLGALLALAIGGGEVRSTSHQRALLRRLCETIQQRCQDPDFDPAALAAEHGLSKRYVHTLFAAHNTCFGTELRECRLRNAHRLLLDRRFSGIGCSEIAWRSGFTSPSHFARCFRDKFGMGPSEFRKTVHS